MARRQIRFDQIGKHMEKELRMLVAATTLEFEGRAKRATPVDTGRLRNNWQTNIEDFEGTITNNLEYAEPVIYGTGLPPSWGGEFKTRQGLAKPPPAFPDLIAKELEPWAQRQYNRIVKNS